jgi:hypothetical protein
MPDNSRLGGRHVYLSFTQEDDGTAGEIARDLEQRGIAVRLDRAGMAWGESWADHVRSAVEQADTFVLVVSQDSSRHVLDWAQAAESLDRRGIDVVAVAVPPPVIQNLAGRPVLEYAGPSAGKRLADRIELGAAMDLDSLPWMQFEALAAELLTRYGYAASTSSRSAVSRRLASCTVTARPSPLPASAWPTTATTAPNSADHRPAPLKPGSTLKPVRRVQVHHPYPSEPRTSPSAGLPRGSPPGNPNAHHRPPTSAAGSGSRNGAASTPPGTGPSSSSTARCRTPASGSQSAATLATRRRGRSGPAAFGNANHNGDRTGRSPSHPRRK